MEFVYKNDDELEKLTDEELEKYEKDLSRHERLERIKNTTNKIKEDKKDYEDNEHREPEDSTDHTPDIKFERKLIDDTIAILNNKTKWHIL